jgi:hypothetical protein
MYLKANQRLSFFFFRLFGLVWFFFLRQLSLAVLPRLALKLRSSFPSLPSVGITVMLSPHLESLFPETPLHHKPCLVCRDSYTVLGNRVIMADV